MAKAHQDQVNWPYAPPHFYPQPPRSYQLPPYPQGRFCQESCCRRTRAPLPYPHPLPPLPPNLQCRPSQENTYARTQQSSQVRGFVPVNPYVQQHGGHPQHPQAAVHRPIPQPRYDYNDFYRYGGNTNNTSNHQGFHPAVLKQNTNTYAVNNSPHVAEQYPACSHYTPMEQESTPNLDVRQFLATWQDKDEEVFEADQQQKPKVQYQEPPPSTDVFKPLDCTKRNDNPLPMYGYNHSQMNNHPAYYNKPLQGVPNHQPLNDSSYKNPSYVTPNAYHPVPVENECNFNTPQVNIPPHSLIESDPQHIGYERRIEKIFNPHGCKGISSAPANENNHCAVDKGSHIEMKAPPLPEKNQYHLSASLECEDLFDDINRKREERQRNIVHPLCYQDNYAQRMNGIPRNKPDIPQVSVKPNTAGNMNYPIDNFVIPDVNVHNEMKKPKVLPLKKWVQKRKKSDDEFFPSFGMPDPNLDFSTRDTVIERSHIQGPCVPEMVLNMNNNHSHSASIINHNSSINTVTPITTNNSNTNNNISNNHKNNTDSQQCVAHNLGTVNPDVSSPKEATNYPPETSDSTSTACIYESGPQIAEPASPVNCLQAVSSAVHCLQTAPPASDCLQSASPVANGLLATSPPSNGLQVTSISKNSLHVSSPSPTSTPQGVSPENPSARTICTDDIDISIASSCDLVMSEDHTKQPSEEIPNFPPVKEENECILELEGTEKSNTKKCGETRNDENDNISKGYSVELVEETESTEKEQQDESSTSSNALKSIAYMYDEMNDENNISENSLDESNGVFKPKKYKRRHGVSVRLPVMKRNQKFSLLTFWRYRNRLFPKSISVKIHSKLACKTRYIREYSKFFVVRKKKTSNVTHKGIIVKSVDQPMEESESNIVDVVVSSLLEGVCQIGEVSSQASDLAEGDCQNPRELLPPAKSEKCDTSNSFGAKPDISGWELAPGDEKVSSTVESDTVEEDESNLVISKEYIGYAEGSIVDGPDDGVLHGILNWPHHEEEITSINDEKESIKVSLPWVKIFKPHSELPDGEKTLEIGPARIELRYSPAPVGYQPGHFKTSRKPTQKKSSIFSVKKVLLKHNARPPTERLPKMVIKKTGCEEYKSYIKDAKLRVISIKNSPKDGHAEVIIEADRPLIESVSNGDNQENSNSESSDLEPSGVVEFSGVTDETEITETSLGNEKELHHCLLCQESFTSMDKLHNHENSLSHRHIDIVQRAVLHKLQKSMKGIELPAFQPLTASELEYLNWRPNFPGYNHFYHNVPL